jgi:hypothetical protein
MSFNAWEKEYWSSHYDKTYGFKEAAQKSFYGISESTLLLALLLALSVINRLASDFRPSDLTFDDVNSNTL